MSGLVGLVGLQSNLVDLVNAAVITADLEGRITSVNAAAEKLYGWEREAILGRLANEVAAVAISPDVQHEIARAITGDVTWEGTFEVTRRDGSKVAVRAIDSPLYDREGKLTGVFSIGIDVSHEHEIERRLEEQTRIADLFRFLEQCTTALTSAIAFDERLNELARLAVAFISDICLVDVVDGTGIRRMAAAHRDPARQKLVDQLAGYGPEDDHPAARAIRTGVAESADAMPDDFLRETTIDDKHFAIVKELGFQSFMSVPLIARGRVLGAMTLVSCDSARRFGPDDLGLVQEVAWRAALALDNARVYAEHIRVSQVLQASLLPPELPDVPGARLAARYVAAEEGLDVGGDFYDVFDAGYGSWTLTIGDVCGRGPEAAAYTGLVRHTVRSLAMRERDPGGLLAMLNAVLHRDLDDPAMFCTVLYAVLRRRPDGLLVRVASGGHPAPVVVRADGTIAELVTTGLVLGPFETGQWTTATTVLHPGDTIVLFTDGLSEARHGEAQFGDERMNEVLRSVAGTPPDQVVNALVDAANAFALAARPDDVAVLAVQSI